MPIFSNRFAKKYTLRRYAGMLIDVRIGDYKQAIYSLKFSNLNSLDNFPFDNWLDGSVDILFDN